MREASRYTQLRETFLRPLEDELLWRRTELVAGSSEQIIKSLVSMKGGGFLDYRNDSCLSQRTLLKVVSQNRVQRVVKTYPVTNLQYTGTRQTLI